MKQLIRPKNKTEALWIWAELLGRKLSKDEVNRPYGYIEGIIDKMGGYWYEY